jgi:hypothetical protein
LLLPQWVSEDCLLPIAEHQEDEGVNLDLLMHYCHETALLLYRAGPNYHEADKIRKKDKGVAVDPLAYPPERFSREYRDKDLPKARQLLDTEAIKFNPAFSRFSFAETAAKAVAYFYNFYLPNWWKKNIGVEYDGSPHNIKFNDSLDWTLFIDWVYETHEGAIIICDHKTNKECPTGLDVLYHSQLNAYAGVWYEITGRLPDYIAISYPPTGEHILAKTDIRIVGQTLTYLRSIQTQIDLDSEHDTWVKAFPSDYGTPCWKRNFKSKNLDDVCPYLENCWPQYADLIKPELAAFRSPSGL